MAPDHTFVKWAHGYSLKLKTTEVSIDSVGFTDPYFDKVLLGTVVDKLRANVTETSASYPRFESYDLRKRINEIVPDIDFEGGFTMQGAKLQGYGTMAEPATLIFKRANRSSQPRGLCLPSNRTKYPVKMWQLLLLDKDSITTPV